MKLWIDDIRPAPEGYVWCKSFEEVLKEFNDWIAQEIRKELGKPQELIGHGCRRKN